MSLNAITNIWVREESWIQRRKEQCGHRGRETATTQECLQPPRNWKRQGRDSSLEPLEGAQHDSLSIETDCRGDSLAVEWLRLWAFTAQGPRFNPWLRSTVLFSPKKEEKETDFGILAQICTRINVCYFNPPSLWSAGIQRFITLPSLLVCLETFLIKLCLCVLNSQHYLCNSLAKEIETELGNSTTSLQNIQKRNRS